MLFKKTVSAIAALTLILMIPMNVFAENVPTEVYYYDEISDGDIEYEEYDSDDVHEALTVDYYVKAEDGADAYIYFRPDGRIMGSEIGSSNPEDEYDFPEYKGGTGTYYTDEEQIPLIENQVLCKIEYIVSREDGSGFTGDKFYIVDYESKTLTYAGHSVLKEIEPVQSDPQYFDALAGAVDAGFTDNPDTGKSYGFIAVGIASLSVIFLSRKRSK